MCYKEKSDAGQNLQKPHAYKNTSYRTARPDQKQRYCDQGSEKERFFKAHFSMSEISTPFPTWRLQHVHIIFINLTTFLSAL
jgi:hypothetical protein